MEIDLQHGIHTKSTALLIVIIECRVNDSMRGRKMTIGEAFDKLQTDGIVIWRHGWNTGEDPLYISTSKDVLEMMYSDGVSFSTLALTRKDVLANDWSAGSRR